MKIAILGTRGIPANYGGFETFAEQLGTRLAARGHEVTVYGRQHYVTSPERTYRGVKLVVLPTIQHKYFDTVVHSFLSVLHAILRRYDVILICNAANSIFAFLPRLVGTPTLVNVDGLERKRKKWNWVGRSYYQLAEWLSTFLPTEIVTGRSMPWNCVRAMTLRMRSPASRAPPSFVSGKTTTNSSPPKRASASVSRIAERSACATPTRTASPRG